MGIYMPIPMRRTVDDIRITGRGNKRWDECVDEDMTSLGLNRKDAQDGVVWKSCTSGNGPMGSSDL